MNLSSIYLENNKAHKYILGVCYKGVIYAVTVSAEEIMLYATISKASRNGGNSLRFLPNNTLRENLIFNHDAIALMTKADFNKKVRRSKYNRGEIFEREIFKHYGKRWKKDTVPFYKDGDITIDGEKIQIKFEKATFITSAQAERLEG